jgi:hypothetical protein
LIAFTLVCGFSVNSYAQDKIEFSGACVYPTKPTIVNGNTATEAEMIKSQQDMKAYLALGNEFLTCLDKEATTQIKADTPKEQADEFKARIDATHNAAVDDMNAIAELFNAALRAFKGKNQ